jgi:hypothetical protein
MRSHAAIGRWRLQGQRTEAQHCCLQRLASRTGLGLSEDHTAHRSGMAGRLHRR